MRTPRLPLRTERLTLRPYRESDLDALHETLSDPEVARYLYQPPVDRAGAVEALERRRRRTRLEEDGDALCVALEPRAPEGAPAARAATSAAEAPGAGAGRERAGGAAGAGGPPPIVGEALLSLRSLQHRQGEIGYILHPRAVGRGYATEASRELLRVAFEELELHRVIARCDARNRASWRVMERLGMRREAHLRQNELVKGEWCDELVYAMLREEWVAGREG